MTARALDNPYAAAGGVPMHAVPGTVEEHAMAMAYGAHLDALRAAGAYPTLQMHEAFADMPEGDRAAWRLKARERIASEAARAPRPDRILAAASVHEGEVVAFPAPARHGDTFRKVLERYPEAERPVCPPDCQGFITEDGRYVDRAEAARLALASGQVARPYAAGQLFSEDLW